MDKGWKAKWITDSKFLGLTPINIFHKEMTELGETGLRDDLIKGPTGVSIES